MKKNNFISQWMVSGGSTLLSKHVRTLYLLFQKLAYDTFTWYSHQNRRCQSNNEIIVRDANKKQYKQSIFSIKMNPSNRVLNLELFSKGDRDQLKRKLIWICLFIEGIRNRKRGFAWEQRNRRTIEPLKLRLLWECNFWSRFLLTNMLQNKGVFLMSRDMIPEPSKTNFQSSNIIKLIPRAPPLVKPF